MQRKDLKIRLAMITMGCVLLAGTPATAGLPAFTASSTNHATTSGGFRGRPGGNSGGNTGGGSVSSRLHSTQGGTTADRLRQRFRARSRRVRSAISAKRHPFVSASSRFRSRTITGSSTRQSTANHHARTITGHSYRSAAPNRTRVIRKK